MQPNPSGLAADRGGPNRQPDNPQRILFADDERSGLTTQLARWRELAERQLDEEAEQP